MFVFIGDLELCVVGVYISCQKVHAVSIEFEFVNPTLYAYDFSI